MLAALIAVAAPWSMLTAEVIYEEDFSAGQTLLEKWPMKDPSFWTVTPEGHLASSAPEGTNIVGCASPKFGSETDLTFQFDFQFTTGKELNFKLNYARGGHIYRFIVNHHGFNLRLNKNAQIPILEPVNMESFKARIQPGVWHSMTITARGDTVTGSIAGIGEMSYRSEHFALPIGNLGLSASRGEVLFDNIQVSTGQGSPAQAKAAPAEPRPAPESAPAPRMNPTPAASPTNSKSGAVAPLTEARSVTRPTPVSLTPETPPDAPEHWIRSLDGFLAEHCYECHDDVVAKADLDLFSLSTDVRDPETLRRWMRIFDRVKHGEMPPEKKPRPEEEAKAAFLAELAVPLAAGHQSQRETVLRRLNRAEYENTVNDLFGIDLRLRESFPADAKKHGFDNNGEGLTLSSEQIQLYLDAANQAFDRAIGPKVAPEPTRINGPIQDYIHPNMYGRWQKLIGDERGTVIYSSEFGAGSQMNQLKLKEPGTYRWRFHAKAFQTDQPVMMQIQTGMLTRQGDKRFIGFFEISPEGRVVEFTDHMEPGESAYPRPFGTLKNISGYLGPNQGKDRGLTIHDYDGAGLLIESFELEGPIDAWPPPSRSLLLGEVDLATGTAAEAHDILTRFLPRAFRRAVDEKEVVGYSAQVTALMTEGRSFEESLRWAITAALCSADFLFLEEPATEDGMLEDEALASRLSYYLWSSMPDAELTELAETGRLRDPQILFEQTERMLADERAAAFTDNFAHQWLHLREIDATSPDTTLFPDFDIYLEDSMVKESEALFETVLQQNLSLRHFIDSDWVMVNERLAEHYGIPGVTGEAFRQVSLPTDSPRGGIMTQASVLKITANGANTSPVERGVWILENLLGIHPPPPPPAVPAVVPDVTGANTLRQLLAKHRNVESCNSCHKLIDPPGFALESFDPIGAWRDEYRFQGSKKLLPVDASGQTKEGQPFQDVRDYKKILLAEIDQVAHGMTEKLLTYATGRAMGFSDRQEIHRLVKEIAERDYAFRDLIHATVQSPLFHQP